MRCAGCDAEDVGDRRVQVDVGRERVDGAGRSTPGHATSSGVWPEVRVDRDAGLAERVALAEVVAVIGAEHDRGVVPELLRVELVEDAAEPVVDHRQLRLVVGADLARLARLQARPWRSFRVE